MNKVRRTELSKIMEQLEELKGSLEDLLQEEEEYRDGMPENLCGSERYEKAESACDNLQNAIDGLDDVVSSIDEATE